MLIKSFLFFSSDPEPVIGMSISTRKNPKGKHVIVEGDFTMTKDVKTRMEKLCGATNFSLGLRNSEHAARYKTFLYALKFKM